LHGKTARKVTKTNFLDFLKVNDDLLLELVKNKTLLSLSKNIFKKGTAGILEMAKKSPQYYKFSHAKLELPEEQQFMGASHIYEHVRNLQVPISNRTKFCEMLQDCMVFLYQH
jgi:hypothetical protein